jgi:hypothetical protein
VIIATSVNLENTEDYVIPRQSPHKDSSDGDILYCCWVSPQPFPLDIEPEPNPVMSLIAEALRLYCEILGLFYQYPVGNI